MNKPGAILSRLMAKKADKAAPPALHKKKPAQYRFRSTDQIGANGAEEDQEFLEACFVDTGRLTLLKDFTDRRVILLGRTGAGKSALLSILQDHEQDHVVRISPESLALSYVANSTILNFFASLGVNLDPFFKLLWRHVLAVELLGRHFEDSPVTGSSLIDRIRAYFSGAARTDRDAQQAASYLAEYGNSFWQETEYRVKEITTTIESQLQAEVNAKLGARGVKLGGGASTSETLSETEKSELLKRGQEIVVKAQVQDLQKILALVDKVLEDRQRRYHILVDDLDGDWVDERLRYRLIMALIVCARDFVKVRNVKVILALRRDLLERVFRLTRDSGFQEEKYQSMYLPVTWSKDEILEVLDRRITHLIKRAYGGGDVGHRELLPKQFRNLDIGDYVYSVAKRPRDVIAFFNTCIAAAPGLSRLSTKELKIAEGEYSRSRLRALASEWYADYPDLIEFATILTNRPSSFKVSTLTLDEVEHLCLTVAANHPITNTLTSRAMAVVDRTMETNEFRRMLVGVFYQIGLVGLKLTPHETESWSDDLGRSISAAEINEATSVVIHPAYRRTLGVTTT